MNKYVKKTVQGLLLGIGLIIGAFPLYLFLATPFMLNNQSWFSYVEFYILLCGAWLSGLLILAAYYRKKYLFIFVMACIFILAMRLYFAGCPADMPFGVGGRCYSCNTDKKIMLEHRLTQKQENICPNRVVIKENCFFYSVLKEQIEDTKLNPDTTVCLDGGYFGEEGKSMYERSSKKIGVLLSLTLIWGVLFWRKKKNG